MTLVKIEYFDVPSNESTMHVTRPIFRLQA